MNEWASKNLGELVTFQKGRKVDTSPFPQPGYEAYLGAGALSGKDDGYGSTFLSVQANENDVLMLWDGERSGLTQRGLSGVVSSTVCKLSPNGSISSELLYYFLIFNFEWIQNRRTGTGVPHVPKDIGRILEISYPSDKAEQQKIARILQTIDRAIEQTEALIDKYQQIKTGLMHDLFTRGIGPDGQLRPPREQAPHLYQQTPFGWIPKEWGYMKVADSGSVKLGRQRSPDQHSGKWTMPYLRVANVFDGYFKLDDVLEMDFTPIEREVFSLISGDILLNEGQSLELVGRSALYTGEDGIYCFQNTLLRFRCYEPNLPTFFAHLFKYYLDIERFMRIASQTTSVAHLGADRFANLECPEVPPDEQKIIAKKLDQVSLRLRVETELLHKLQKLKSGLMHDLLTGKVPVAPDPEAAHV